MKRDKRKGFQTLKSAANYGSVAAHNELGKCFRYGIGMEWDQVEAMNHYKAGAEAGHGKSFYSYGMCWIDGIGMEKNKRHGLAMLRSAANDGSELAMEELGYFYRYWKKVEKDLNEAALKGNVYTMAIIGEWLIRGIGVQRDVEKDVTYLMEAGAAEWDHAFYTLADFYWYGIGVPMNKKKALELYKRAGEECRWDEEWHDTGSNGYGPDYEITKKHDEPRREEHEPAEESISEMAELGIIFCAWYLAAEDDKNEFFSPRIANFYRKIRRAHERNRQNGSIHFISSGHRVSMNLITETAPNISRWSRLIDDPV